MSAITPEEANSKWCVQGITAEKVVRCEASKCMAWRWSRAKETKAFLDAVRALMSEKKIDFSKATNEVFAERGATFEQIEGFCGLASKP